MNIPHSSHSTVSGPGWQLLGETALQAGSNEDSLNTWFIEIISPLNVNRELVKQLLSSAQQATLRALESNMSVSGDIGANLSHVHVCVFVPNDIATHGSTWGFFRIEKIGSTELNNHHSDHAVEFYLYLEGQ